MVEHNPKRHSPQELPAEEQLEELLALADRLQSLGKEIKQIERAQLTLAEHSHDKLMFYIHEDSGSNNTLPAVRVPVCVYVEALNSRFIAQRERWAETLQAIRDTKVL